MKYKSILFWLAIFGILFVFLQMYSEFHFYCLEQNQLFQFTTPYIVENIAMPGGLTVIVSEFLVQFFVLPYMGAALTAALLTAIGIGTEAVVRRIAPRSDAFALYLLPIATLLFIHFSFNYRMQGTVAYGLVLLALYIRMGIPSYMRRLATDLVFSVLLFALTGSAAGLYALAATAYELLNRTPRGYYSLSACAVVMLLGVCSVYFSVTGEYRLAFLPDAYYHLWLKPDDVIYYSWISLLLIIGIAFFIRNKKPLSGKKMIAGCLLQVLLIAGLCWWGVPKYGDSKSYKVKELDYYTGTEQWDKIIDASKGPLTNYLNMCYLNMALAHTNRLTEQLFDFDQRGTQGLVASWNKSANISSLLSDTYFAMGNVSNAQEMAFEAYISTPSAGNPRMLKRLVQTNLIYGTYPVAEKYINILANTYHYANWAEKHRPLLYNDALVEADPLLGTLRKCLPDDNYLIQTDGLNVDLRRISEKNPSYCASFQYLGACYLLSKDLDNFKWMIEKYYGTELLPTLPICYQEAIITLSEKEPDYWKRFNISETIVQRFAEYKKQVLANKNSSALPGLMNRAYGNTYWFYYMFK